MNTLINIWQTKGGRAVSARELHSVLGVGRDFSTWIKNRIAEYNFEENIDFQIIKGEIEFTPSTGKTVGRLEIEYALNC